MTSAIMADGDEQVKILSTIRYDPKTAGVSTEETLDALLLLPLHIDRLRRAWLALGFDETLTKPVIDDFVKTLVECIHDEPIKDAPYNTSFKVRALTDGTGRTEISGIVSVPPLCVSMLDVESLSDHLYPPSINERHVTHKVYVDDRPSETSIYTAFKTTRRDVYSQARQRFNLKLGEKAEVLLRNKDDQIIEGSITNVAILKKNSPSANAPVWLTPPLFIGCLDGVMRRHLVENGLLYEGLVSVKDLPHGTIVLLFNAVTGITVGRVENN